MDTFGRDCRGYAVMPPCKIVQGADGQAGVHNGEQRQRMGDQQRGGGIPAEGGAAAREQGATGQFCSNCL